MAACGQAGGRREQRKSKGQQPRVIPTTRWSRCSSCGRGERGREKEEREGGDIRRRRLGDHLIFHVEEANEAANQPLAPDLLVGAASKLGGCLRPADKKEEERGGGRRSRKE